MNPEPIAEFIDGAVLGDGEQAVLAITTWSGPGRRPAGRAGGTACSRSRPARGVDVPRFMKSLAAGAGPSARDAESPGHPRSVAKHTVMDLDPGRTRPGRWSRWPSRPPAVQRGDLPGLHQGLPVLPGGHDDEAGPGTIITTIGSMVDAGLGRERLQRGRPAVAVEALDERPSTRLASTWPTGTKGTKTGPSCLSTLVDASDVLLLMSCRGTGACSGADVGAGGRSTWNPKVINKMGDEGYLIKDGQPRA